MPNIEVKNLFKVELRDAVKYLTDQKEHLNEKWTAVRGSQCEHL